MSPNDRTELPFVSVIVPLHNEAKRISVLLAALQNQTYPHYEILLVDNDSTDETARIARQRSDPRTRLLFETRVRNPDTARNSGSRQAEGDLFAFTDGDCLPDSRWLEAAVRTLQSQRADLVAGQIDFDLPERPNAAQVYDSISFLQHSDSVGERGVAFTCNLMVSREAMTAVGGFMTDGGWNGDVIFTRRAVQKGFRLVYAKEARVRHPVRSWTGLMNKVWRISFSKALCRKAKGQGAGAFFLEPKPHIRHLNPKRVSDTLKVRFGKAPLFETLSVALVAWGVAAIGGTAFVSGFAAQWFRQAVDSLASLFSPQQQVPQH